MSELALRYDGTDIPYHVAAAQFDVEDDAFDFFVELQLADRDNENVPREIMIRLTRRRRGQTNSSFCRPP